MRNAKMLSAVVLFVLFIFSTDCQAQLGPLGDYVRQGSAKVPPSIRRQLPQDAVVQLHCIRDGLAGDAAVVYELGDEYSPVTYVAFFNEGRRKRTLEMYKDFRAVECVWARLDDDRKYLLIAGRNIGDGSATKFLAYAADANSYRKILSKWMTQAQVRIGPSPGALEFWTALDDGKCVWCTHQYSVSKFSWIGESFVLEEHRVDRRWRRPETLAERPLVIFDEKTAVR